MEQGAHVRLDTIRGSATIGSQHWVTSNTYLGSFKCPKCGAFKSLRAPSNGYAFKCTKCAWEHGAFSTSSDYSSGRAVFTCDSCNNKVALPGWLHQCQKCMGTGKTLDSHGHRRSHYQCGHDSDDNNHIWHYSRNTMKGVFWDLT